VWSTDIFDLNLRSDSIPVTEYHPVAKPRHLSRFDYNRWDLGIIVPYAECVCAAAGSVVRCRALSCAVVLCRALSCSVVLCRALSCAVLLCRSSGNPQVASEKEIVEFL
jgi:hypothetical protein